MISGYVQFSLHLFHFNFDSEDDLRCFSRPIRSTEFFAAQIWNQRIEGIPFEKVANNELFKSLTVLQAHSQLNSTS